MERLGTGSRQRRSSSTAQKVRLGECNVGVRDHISNGSFMDIETRSRAETPSGSNMGVKTRLKECSNALTTSKELLKIINRMWGQEDRPSSSMSLVSALHSELERARLHVNQLIHEHKPENNDITNLIQRFSEEKAAWKNNEQEVVEAAIEYVSRELEVERKLRRRFESLNKKLGKELAETKTEVEELKRESFKVKEEVEKEREMLQLADALREERAKMKLSEAKHQLEEENADVDKVRNQLRTYLKAKRCKEKKLHNQESGEYFIHHNVEDGEVEDEIEEEDLHSIELDIKSSKSTPSQSLSLQKSISDWVVQSEKLKKGRGLDLGRYIEVEHRGYLDNTQACKPYKDSSKDYHIFSGPGLSNFRRYRMLLKVITSVLEDQTCKLQNLSK